MSLTILHERDIIAIPKKEQGLAWLVENGPIVADPPLPGWMLVALANEDRILRLRRGLYAVPTEEGRLPTLPRVLSDLAEGGYISGYAAFGLQGLNDQEARQWSVITARRQGDIQYGQREVHFLTSPHQAKSGRTLILPIDGAKVRVATPAQALVDELRFAPFGIDYVALARVVRRAVAAKRLHSREVADIIDGAPARAVGRRAGFLFDVVGAEVDPRLRELAAAHRGTTDAGRFALTDPRWHLAIPESANEIRRAAR